jgi:hypothetical protein
MLCVRIGLDAVPKIAQSYAVDLAKKFFSIPAVTA